MANQTDTEESGRPPRHAGLPARFKDFELSPCLSKSPSGAEGGDNSTDFGPIPRTPKDKIDFTALEKENEL